MAKKRPKKQKAKSEWSQRQKLSPEECLKRMKEFPKRRDAFIAAIREGTNKCKSA